MILSGLALEGGIVLVVVAARKSPGKTVEGR